jgi:hypothetical protein
MKAILVGLLLVSANGLSASSFDLKGLIQVGMIQTESSESWLTPWLNGGVGVVRNEDGTQLNIDYALLEFDYSFADDWALLGTANYLPDGNRRVGISESYFQYKPLPRNYNHTLKVGLFYPQFSLENSDIAWTSPYGNSFSAINSWVAEELRPLGVEWQVKRAGRRYNSPHSYTFTVAAYQHNDGLGSLLAWRGWALHNRQSVFHEKIDFANYFQFMPVENPNPTYVDISDETDGRVGYYLGGHWQYFRKTDVRLYFYDNLADPFSIEKDKQYGWRTQFWSVALQHKFSPSFRILAQVMTGNTEMGNMMKGVFSDFESWYVIANYQFKKHRLSLRYDSFFVTDDDINPFDPNASEGDSLALNWRYVLNKNVHVGAELLYVTSDNENRELWANWESRQTQEQMSLFIQLRFN